MKKWLIALSIIFTAGFVSTAALAGRVYYKDLKVYTDEDRQELKTEALNNVYINSSIPVEIYPTTQVPYVEFNQTFTDLIGSAPEYELNVETKGDTTYIDLNQTKENFIWLGVKESKAQLAVYLPQSTINRLSIEDQGYYYNNRRDKQVINLEGINVNELSANMNCGEFRLSGSYGKVNISARGTLTLNSTTPAQVYIEDTMNQYLTGEFSKITVKYSNGSDININSNTECQVDINSYSGTIDLKGKYSRVKLTGANNNVDLRSDSICRLISDGDNNTIVANGPFNEMSVDGEQGDIEVQTTVVPSKINLGRELYRSDISLTVPSNIPGFTVKYLSDYEISEDEREYYRRDYGIEGKDLQSDFILTEGTTNRNEIAYTYGDGSLVLNLGAEYCNTLEIIDGGYSSSTAQ